MIPVELLRRYPFFAGFTRDQIDDLASAAEEVAVKADHLFISEGERVTNFYLVLEVWLVLSSKFQIGVRTNTHSPNHR